MKLRDSQAEIKMAPINKKFLLLLVAAFAVPQLSACLAHDGDNRSQEMVSSFMEYRRILTKDGAGSPNTLRFYNLKFMNDVVSESFPQLEKAERLKKIAGYIAKIESWQLEVILPRPTVLLRPGEGIRNTISRLVYPSCRSRAGALGLYNGQSNATA
jgi:hypothetical protein